MVRKYFNQVSRCGQIPILAWKDATKAVFLNLQFMCISLVYFWNLKLPVLNNYLYVPQYDSSEVRFYLNDIFNFYFSGHLLLI